MAERKDKRSSLVFPVPEAIDGEEWEVNPAYQHARTDSVRKRMEVPVMDTEKDQYTRNHEMAHAKWSPKKKPIIEGVPDICIQTVEDMRMNKLLMNNDIKIDVDVSDGDPRYIERFEALKDDDPTMGPATLIATMGTKTFPLIKARSSKTDIQIARSVRKKLMTGNGGHPNFTDTIEASKLFADLVAAKQEAEENSKEAEQEGKDGDAGEKTAEGLEAIEDRYAPDDEDETLGAGDAPERVEDEAVWGQMRIVRPEMPTVHAAGMEGMSKIASDTGVVPTNMSRYCTDMKIFSHKRKKMDGGSVLIDCSGSMNLSVSEIRSYLQKYPAGTMALYSSGNRDDGVGVLMIIAENGRCVDLDILDQLKDDAGMGWGNLVDGPALDWLSKQGQTRVWVSDGMVTGIVPGNGYYEEFTNNLLTDAKKKCIAGNIKRVLGLDEVIEEDYRKDKVTVR